MGNTLKIVRLAMSEVVHWVYVPFCSGAVVRSLDDAIHSEGILISDIDGLNEASNISVSDVAGNYVSNDVESVLAEIAAQPAIQIISKKDTPIYTGAKLIIDVTEEIEDLNKNNNTTE